MAFLFINPWIPLQATTRPKVKVLNHYVNIESILWQSSGGNKPNCSILRHFVKILYFFTLALMSSKYFMPRRIAWIGVADLASGQIVHVAGGYFWLTWADLLDWSAGGGPFLTGNGWKPTGVATYRCPRGTLASGGCKRVLANQNSALDGVNHQRILTPSVYDGKRIGCLHL